MKKILIILTLILLWSCSDDNRGTEGKLILTINIPEDAIALGDRLFYSIKGENGTDLGVGELFNMDVEIINAPYTGNLLSISMFYYDADRQQTFVESFFDIPLEEELSYRYRLSETETDATAQMRFENKDEQVFFVCIARPGGDCTGATGTSPPNGEVFSVPFFSSDPFSIVTTKPVMGDPSYQVFQLNEVDEFEIDLNNNIEMENSQLVTSDLGGNLNYTLDVKGLRDNGTDLQDDYSLYVDFLTSPGPQFFIPTPAVFNEFHTTIFAADSNVVYFQLTQPEVPDRFDFIDPELSVNEDFTNYQIFVNSTDLVSSIRTSWQDLGTPIIWDIYSPEKIRGDYEIDEVPIEISNEIPIGNVDNLVINSMEAENFNDQSWTMTMERKFSKSSSRFSEKSLIKLVSF